MTEPTEAERRQAAIDATIEARKEAENRMKAEAWLRSMNKAFKGIHRPSVRFRYLRRAMKELDD